VVCFNFRAECELVKALKTKGQNETSQDKDPKHNTPPWGEKQSEASFGSLILLPRLQLLFEES
jgi:hypothetical protein